MSKDRILVSGGSGLVGRHLINALHSHGYMDIHAPRSSEIDFTNFSAVDAYVTEIQPTYIFSLAALVGGILDNKRRPADFYWINSQIGNVTFQIAKKHKVKNLICVGAGCGYPMHAPEPLSEDSIWDGFPQQESAPYSIAKKTLIIQSIAYWNQHNMNSTILIPSNIYGEYDNFHLENAHVIPALVHKFFIASKSKKAVPVWGNGSARRDFLYAGDFAEALVQSMRLTGSNLINISSGKQHSISEVCETLSALTGDSVDIEYDESMPSGQKSREFCNKHCKVLLPQLECATTLEEGLTKTFSWFSENYERGEVRI